jgi:two-component system, OmpR family, phosphate regulon sensor histidine kinase PhoR
VRIGLLGRSATTLALLLLALLLAQNHWLTSLLLVLFAGCLSIWNALGLSRRIRALEEFSKHVAATGDFHPFETSGRGDELDDLASAFNATAARLAETIRVLSDERNREATILGSMIEGVAVISARERVLYSNRAFAQILDLEGQPTQDRALIEIVRHTGLLAVIKEALRAEKQQSSEIVVGTVRPRSFSVTATPVRAGGASGAVLVLHEITDLRRLERVRQDFVANVSHEFRTPLTAIQGFAETLLGGALDDPEHRRRFVEIIRDHAMRLARLTEDLLELSRIEAGQLKLEFRPVSVPQLVTSCIETTQLAAGTKQLTLKSALPADLPEVQGDANRLQQVLQNLLDNAVQYTPSGGKITAEAKRTRGEVIITVSDTGIGVPQSDQSRIFERFYRVDAARSREAGGTGLGLSIARHIVEAHGGRIWVDSTVGEGSQFHFSIPAVKEH